LLIAQISDPHLATPGAELFGGYRPDAALAAVLERVAALDPRPDFVWLTGDLVENGTAAEYAHFRSRIAGFDLPMAAIPGNHDRRAAFVAGLAGSGIAVGTEPFLHLVVEERPVRMIGLDTLGPDGAAPGLLCPVRLAWVAARLAEAPGRPTVLFMHHPPFRNGIPFSDASRCIGGDELAGIVARQPNVLMVSCGHVHRPIQTAWAGTVASVCPGVCWAVPLDLSHGGRPRLERQRPGFQLHLWRAGTGLVTHTEYLAD
jgi:3',5'-cyclic AMP phosphodiesterase CpdA